MEPKDVSIIICCAGMGIRLGIGSTKALLDIGGKSLIIRQLEMLNCYDDVRLVVGYQAERVINEVNRLRTDIMYAFNYDYRTTGEAESLSKALIGLRKYTVVIDGDIIMNEGDFKEFLEYPNECIGVCSISSDEPIYATLNQKNEVIGLSAELGTHEFSCILKVMSERLELLPSQRNIYEMIRPLLPIHAITLRSRDIDTPDDYERIIKWFNEDCG